MQRWIFPLVSLLVCCCGSHREPTAVSLDQPRVKLGRTVHLRVEHAPQGWTGQVTVNGSRYVHIDAQHLSVAINSYNGFPDRGAYNLSVGLIDSGGYEIPLARRELRLEVLPSSVRLIPDSDEASSAGGSGEIRINAAGDYRWSAGNLPAWLQLTSAPEGTGDGIIEYKVAANITRQNRSAGIEIGDAIFTITQPAARLPGVRPGAPAEAAANSAPDSRSSGARITFSKDTLREGEELQITLDHLPAVWTGDLLVNARRFALDSKTYKLAVTEENGFRASGTTDIYVRLLDGGGKQISLPDNGYYRVTVQPNPRR